MMRFAIDALTGFSSAHHLPQRIFGLAREALLAVVDEGDLPEPDPGDHTADEARLLGHRQQRIERPAAHQPEVAGVDRNVDFGCPREKALEAVRSRPLERRLAGAAAANALDSVRP